MSASPETSRGLEAPGRRPARRPARGAASALTPDPLWYRNAVIYQLHVRSFCDSTGDGVGDFNGLISKLDYLAELGVTALWLQPFYPSPLRDDGYDIADYVNVNPAYGRLSDFVDFVEQAHRRGMRVITELVINHTSDQHAWFQRARRAPKGSPERAFYVWSDTAEAYRDARIIFKDFERSNWTWDPVAQQYYWHRFYSHQPDLNFDNPAVHRAVFDICDHWMSLGVDGVRLDAIPYLYEREGTSCENLPETHAFLRALRAHVDARWPGRMLLAEANQWPEDAVAYFGAGDECHMAFHFPLMPRLFMALRMEDRFPITDILDQTPPIPDGCQWAMFLRNHDELTLEMVTDEERDYMYRVYARDRQARINLGIRRRLAPLLSNNRRKIELMNALLFSMPGTPIIYYGDEIGMGDNVHLGDRNGVRTPMQWSADRNAGFSRANPQSLFLPTIIDPEYHYEAVNVESQAANPSSLLWWMKRLIALRKRHPVFGVGDIRFLPSSNPRVLAFVRSDAEHTVLVVANLSRFAQPVEIPLEGLEGRRLTEVFGRTPFPPVGAQPYFLSMGPHSFFWFLAERDGGGGEVRAESALPLIRVADPWDRLWESETFRRALEQTLPEIVAGRRWFVSKNRETHGVSARQRLRLPAPRGVQATLVLAEFSFTRGEPETYALPLMIRPAIVSSPLDSPASAAPAAASAVARLTDAHGETRELVDAMTDPECVRALLRLAVAGGELESGPRRLVGRPAGRRAQRAEIADLAVRLPRVDQSNSTAFFGERYVLKLFRRIEEGENPEAEVGRHLTERVRFPHAAPLAGSVEIQEEGRQPMTVAAVMGFVHSEGDAWEWMLQRAVRFLEGVAVLPPEQAAPLLDAPSPEAAFAWVAADSGAGLDEPAPAPSDGDGLPPSDALLGAGTGPDGPAATDASGANRVPGADRSVPEIPPHDPTAGPAPAPPHAAAGDVVHHADLLREALDAMALLGRRSAELHAALSVDAGDPAFTPEPVTSTYLRAVSQSMRQSHRAAVAALTRAADELAPEAAERARTFLAGEDAAGEIIEAVRRQPPTGLRIRLHGDYHLGQVLHTGKDFVIVDFEGEPLKSIGERRLKASPLRDVAGMLRSIDYSAWAALRRHRELMPGEQPQLLELLSRAAEAWRRWMSRAFAAAYFTRLSALAPEILGAGADPAAIRAPLRAWLFQKACYEIVYELNSRPDWVEIPLAAAAVMLDEAARRGGEP